MNASHLMVAGSEASKEDDVFPFPAIGSQPMSCSTPPTATSTVWISARNRNKRFPSPPTSSGCGREYAQKQYDFNSTAAKPVLGILAPDLSPDGKQIAFTALNNLWVMKIGEKPQQLTHDTYFEEGAQWSPDGK